LRALRSAGVEPAAHAGGSLTREAEAAPRYAAAW